jgi:hypothetical protein
MSNLQTFADQILGRKSLTDQNTENTVVESNETNLQEQKKDGFLKDPLIENEIEANIQKKQLQKYVKKIGMQEELEDFYNKNPGYKTNRSSFSRSANKKSKSNY